MKSLFSVPTARLLCFSSNLCSTLAQINPLPGTGIVLRQKIKTMLKSLVPVAFFYALLFMALSSKANSGQPIAAAVKAAPAVRAEDAVLRLPAGRQVTKFVDAYIRINDEDLSLARERSQRPFTVIDSIFREYGLPAELKYLAVIESDLKTGALSRVGARGPWQLMPSTARDLGLKVNRRSDERTNYYKSTRAAAFICGTSTCQKIHCHGLLFCPGWADGWGSCFTAGCSCFGAGRDGSAERSKRSCRRLCALVRRPFFSR